MNQAQYTNGGVEVSLRTGANARLPSRRLQPIRNTDRERVKTHLAENLCRCGAQTRIIDAVEAAWAKAAAGEAV